MIATLMEGDTSSSNRLISSITNFKSESKQNGALKTLLKSFILPETDMAIKHNQNDKCVYTVPVTLPITERMKSINEAKMAFLKSTVNHPTAIHRNDARKEESSIHYAQIAIATATDDPRSTGGGKDKRDKHHVKTKDNSPHIHISPTITRLTDQHQRKVSFKTKKGSASYKRPPIATKTMTITSTKVSELTKKFNGLQNESCDGVPIPKKLVKTLEDLTTASRCSASNSSTPSSTLSSSPNIKIVLRHRRGSKKRSSRKRCSSMDSIDKLVLSDTSAKIRVIRSKSDGTKIPKSPKKCLKYQDSSEQHSGPDCVDGNLSKTSEAEEKDKQSNRNSQSNVVKNVIKKFECEIIAQSSSSNTIKQSNGPKITPPKEKPKVPEKKTSLVLTKNIVVKDGVAKFKTVKAPVPTESRTRLDKSTSLQPPTEISKKKDPIYDRKKYKTNYIHTEKLPLKVVEIIPEDINESNCSLHSSEPNEITNHSMEHNNQITPASKDDKTTHVNEDVNSEIAPNDSFLWRRKSTTPIYGDPDNNESPYCFISITMNETTDLNSNNSQQDISVTKQSQTSKPIESQAANEQKSVQNLDFESNLVEAYNKEVLVGFTSKSENKPVVEDDYEVLEPIDITNIVVIPVKTADRNSKVNCPLPEIPKSTTAPETPDEEKENIYQCLLEMRSHPEGDESSLHNYELCDNALEERTRGDGDSDDGYEYCKSPIKPYCRTSSAGIQIAEDYTPSASDNDKNYTITKSVSGTSTVSYEKIGPERIYEKISHLNSSPKSKGSSPTYSSRHSFMSDYTGYNDNENIYDTIKHSDGASLSHCYESIPNSPSMVKLRNNLKKQLNSAVQKRLSFDTVSNISQSTLSSEQKTNSIYGQRSVISFNGQEIAFQVPSSETSVSDRSDRSDDWVDVSDEEKNDEQKIEIIVQEKSRGRKSPISWSQKVRHQWQKSPKKSDDRECDSSDSGHVYESLEPPGAPAIAPHLDSDSFDSDSDDDGHETPYAAPPSLPPSRLPTPPSGGQYTLTKIASAAQRKMRQIKRKLTKRYSVAMDGIPHFNKSAPQNGIYDTIKSKPTSPVYENYERPEIDHVYSNVAIPEKKTDKLNGAFKDELKTVISDKRLNDPPPLPDKPQEKRDRERSVAEKPVTPNSDVKKDGTLSRKAYFSFKSRFRRATSVAVDINDIPSALKITNSTFYITDSMDGDSGFSNCSDNGQAGSSETLARRRDGTRLRAGWAESSPCLAIERPNVPPPPPPVEPMPLNSNNTSTPNNSSQSNHYEVASVTSSGVVTSSGASSSRTSVIYGRASVASSGASVTSGGASVTPYGVPVTSSGGSGIYGRASDASSGASVTLYGVPVTSSGSLVTSSGASVTSSGVVTSSTSVSPRPPTDLSAVNEELKRLLPTLSRKDKSPRARTSWYAECGGDVTPTQPSSTSWYAETGLYEAGNVSTSSGASSGSHPASPLPHSLFTHEPLYQFYNAAKVESVCRETGDSDSDAYESSPGVAPPPPATASASAPATAPTPAPAPARPSAMALVAPRGPARTLWCEVPEVVNSTVLNSLSPAEKRLQEAKFELLTSEASYLNSLNVLEAHFIAHPAFRDPHILPRGDWETLFSNILPVRKCSQLLMNELEKCWQENILLQGICDIVRSHAEEHFHVYVKYCENQALMVKALQRLRERPNFAAALKRLESHAACQSLSLHSFLLLPMQRVTRLPLLMDAVLRHLPSHSTDYSACMHALATLNHFVMQCNEGARSTERVEEMFRLARVIEFPPHVRRAPLLGPACERRDRRPVRWLVRSGEMTQLVWKADELKLTFGRKFHKVPLYVFLFNDLLVITKRKSEEQYIAVDHCSRSLLEVSSGEGSGAAAGKHALLLTLLENHEGRTIEMLMSLSSETEVSRWSEALCPPSAGAEGEAVYAGWDCPQVCALYAYTPAQPDELPLTEGDIVNVTRKTNEGWYYGERTRDGEAGWFPGSYTAEIASPHVRARNLRQRYRLLALSGTYFGQKKK